MSKPTPGPWAVDPTGDIGPHHVGTADGASPIADVIDWEEGATESNARLIAAAPELLEACQKAISAEDYVRNGGNSVTEKGFLWAEAIAMFRAAIAKAEGK